MNDIRIIHLGMLWVPVLVGGLGQLSLHADDKPAASERISEKIISGPQVGERLAGFDFGGEKCGGADDRFPIGMKLRYY